MIKVVFFELFPVSFCLKFILEGYSWLLQKQVHPNEENPSVLFSGFFRSENNKRTRTLLIPCHSSKKVVVLTQIIKKMNMLKSLIFKI